MSYEKKYYELWQFLAGYFHQDWRDEYDSLNDSVVDYLSSPEDIIKRCYHQLSVLLDECHFEAEWNNIILQRLNCNYNYEYYGMTGKQFLETIRELMRKHAWEIRKIRLN